MIIGIGNAFESCEKSGYFKTIDALMFHLINLWRKLEGNLASIWM